MPDQSLMAQFLTGLQSAANPNDEELKKKMRLIALQRLAQGNNAGIPSEAPVAPQINSNIANALAQRFSR